MAELKETRRQTGIQEKHSTGQKRSKRKTKTFHVLWSSTSSSPVTGQGWPIGFLEVKVPIFLDNGIGWW
jgi:hypothetical protein